MNAASLLASESVLPFTKMKGIPITKVIQVNEGIGYSVRFSCGRNHFSWYSWHDGVTESRFSKHETLVRIIVRGEENHELRRALKPFYCMKIAENKWRASAEFPLSHHLRMKDDVRNWKLYSQVKGRVHTYHHRLTHRILSALKNKGFKVRFIETGVFEVIL